MISMPFEWTNLSNSFRSMFVTRLPNRSTRSTSPASRSSLTVGVGNRQLMNRAGRSAERREIDALREPARGRREAIAPFERPAHGRPRVAPLRHFDDAARGRFPEHGGQHAVVRRHEPVVAGVDDDAAARRSHARIDDHEKDRA